MRFKNRSILLFSIICSLAGPASPEQFEGPSDAFYEKGLKYKQAGNWVKALGTWFAGRQLLEKQEGTDPRIAIAFIETATEENALAYYELASDMYYWGWSSIEPLQDKESVQQEVERIAPILEKQELEEWRRLLKENDPSICQRIVSFWKQKDLTPSTIRNERLLEHWERIAYARANFREARNTVYRCDDRGLIYVKYGKPLRIISGTLGANRAALKSWTDIILDSSGRGRSAIGEGSFNSDAVQQSVLLQEIDRFNNFPEYEIWFYHTLETNEPIFYLFGNREGIGRFGLRGGVEDLIPSKAFLITSARNTRGVSPGVVLQSVYYSELMHLSPYFEDRYRELEIVWESLNSQRGISAAQVNSTLRLKKQHYQTVDTYNPVYSEAPADKSSFFDTVSEIPLASYAFRFLDAQDRPKLALTVFSYPAFKSQPADLVQSDVLRKHSLTHTLIVRDEQKQEIERKVEKMEAGAEYVSTFTLDHRTTEAPYSLSAELFYLKSNQVEFAQIAQVETSPDIIGVGKTDILARPPLRPNRAQLELSDLILGVKTPEESKALPLPYPLVPSKRILATDLLKAYLEVYHLDLGDDGMARFSIDCEIGKLEGKKRSKKESLSVSFEFFSTERTSKEGFDMDISKLTAGNYELTVKVTDMRSGQLKERKAAFEIYNENSRL
ncbi:GWxTD domain-containing protein [bacterium]|nr:GWxTD domain-containing protein [bacterium]